MEMEMEHQMEDDDDEKQQRRVSMVVYLNYLRDVELVAGYS